MSMKIEEILADCLTALEEEGSTVEACLIRYPAQREELEPLLSLAVQLREARALTAPPEYRQVSSTRLRNLIAARPRTTMPSHVPQSVIPNASRRWHIASTLPSKLGMQILIPILVVILTVMGGGGAVVASVHALPTDTLYPVKQAVEAVRLAASLSSAKDLELHLAFATKRLEEAVALLESDRPEAAKGTLERYVAQIEAARSLIEQEDESTVTGAALGTLFMESLSIHEARLTELREQVPSDVHDALNQAIEVSQRGPASEAEPIIDREDESEALPVELPVQEPAEGVPAEGGPPDEPPGASNDPPDEPPGDGPSDEPSDDGNGPPDEPPGNGNGPPDEPPGASNDPPDEPPGDGNGPPDEPPDNGNGPPDEPPGDSNGPPGSGDGPPDEPPGNGNGPPDEPPGDGNGPPDEPPGNGNGPPDEPPGGGRPSTRP
ncbi:MAG: DUF5667 domain-containing protein [Chloroflexota bacterium]|nr:DUF5667 domain-containing protein [Chloroflexota bacterium]